MKKSKVQNSNNSVQIIKFDDVKRNKPFVVFREVLKNEKFEYVGSYESLSKFVDSDEVKGLGIRTNNLPPVLQGKVRSIKGYILFYVDDYVHNDISLTGYNTWIEKNNPESYDFPLDLYIEKGFNVGQKRKVNVEKMIETLKNLGYTIIEPTEESK